MWWLLEYFPSILIEKFNIRVKIKGNVLIRDQIVKIEMSKTRLKLHEEVEHQCHSIMIVGNAPLYDYRYI